MEVAWIIGIDVSSLAALPFHIWPTRRATKCELISPPTQLRWPVLLCGLHLKPSTKEHSGTQPQPCHTMRAVPRSLENRFSCGSRCGFPDSVPDLAPITGALTEQTEHVNDAPWAEHLAGRISRQRVGCFTSFTSEYSEHT